MKVNAENLARLGADYPGYLEGPVIDRFFDEYGIKKPMAKAKKPRPRANITTSSMRCSLRCLLPRAMPRVASRKLCPVDRGMFAASGRG